MARHFKKSGNKKNIFIGIAALIICVAVLFCLGETARHSSIAEIFDYDYVKIKNLITKQKENIKEPDEVSESAEKAAHHSENNSADIKKEQPVTTGVPEPDTDKTKINEENRRSEAKHDEITYNGKAMLAVIVDDGGGNLEYAQKIASLGMPLTWAIMPYERYSQKTAEIASAKKIPYLLHLPMQAEIDKADGPFLIGKGMTQEKIYNVTRDALEYLPSPIGINNHRGSLATSDREVMSPVIEALKEKDLIFVDSRTSQKSVAYDAARSAGIKTLQNRGFLDNTADKNAIDARFHEIVRIAAKKGHFVAICHFRPATTLFLEKLAGEYKNLPVELVTVPQMVERLYDNKDETQ